MAQKKSLKDRAKEFTAQLPIMTGRTKGEASELIGQVVTIRDYGFLQGDTGEYGVFILDDYPEEFFFAGSVLTEQLQEMEKDGYHADIVADGLPMALVTRKSKKGRDYTGVIFYPDTKA